MSEQNIVVPDGMRKAVREALGQVAYMLDGRAMDVILSAALLWLSEHPIVPTDDQARAIEECILTPDLPHSAIHQLHRKIMFSVLLQRRMFLAPK